MREFKPGDRIKHFKGMEYEYLFNAIHSETGEKMAVYKALYGEGTIYVRPFEVFYEEVDKEKYPDVLQKYRFEKISK